MPRTHFPVKVVGALNTLRDFLSHQEKSATSAMRVRSSDKFRSWSTDPGYERAKYYRQNASNLRRVIMGENVNTDVGVVEGLDV